MPVTGNDIFTDTLSKCTTYCMNYRHLHWPASTTITTHLCLCCVTSLVTAADKGCLEKIKPYSKAKK